MFKKLLTIQYETKKSNIVFIIIYAPILETIHDLTLVHKKNYRTV